MTDEIPPAVRTLSQLRAAEAECTRCPLYRFATQVVPGEGPAHARFMLVGEQPGDKEDIAGKPFVGPAGRILDQALADAGIPRKQTFVTNELTVKPGISRHGVACPYGNGEVWDAASPEFERPGTVTPFDVFPLGDGWEFTFNNRSSTPQTGWVPNALAPTARTLAS